MDLLPVHKDLACVVMLHAENGLHDLGASGADQTGQANDLTGADAEADVAEEAGTGKVLHAEHLLPGLDLRLRGTP